MDEDAPDPWPPIKFVDGKIFEETQAYTQENSRYQGDAFHNIKKIGKESGN